MPELPEVETTRRGIAPTLLGARVTHMVVRERRLRWPITSALETTLLNQRIDSVERRAKYLLIGMAAGTLIIHLGMSGSLRLVRAATPLKTHDHWDMTLDNAWLLRFHDPRRFGSLHFTPHDPLQHPLLRRLGPEPLSPLFDGAYLFKKTRKRNVSIKQLIMDAHLVVGVGNIYASEALFRAGIAPRRRAGRVTRVQAAKLTEAIKSVLTLAIETGGTTLRDYVDPEGAHGLFRQKLYVYDRAGSPCRVCRQPIKHFTQGQRSTYWCSTCQR